MDSLSRSHSIIFLIDIIKSYRSITEFLIAEFELELWSLTLHLQSRCH